MERLKLTKDGIKKLNEELEEKEEELRKLGKYKGDAAANEGDAWHDNFAFEQTEIKERALKREIEDLRQKIAMAEIIKISDDGDNDKIKIGSNVTVLLKYSEEDEEELSFVMLDLRDSKNNSISINSPIGELIKGQKVGFTGKYTVGENIIHVKVLSVKN